MRHARAALLGSAVAVALWGASAAAQSRTFIARLAVVPLTVAMQETVAGQGSATAMLTGNRLTIEGTFEGLRSPATSARLHLAPRAMRGTAIADLTVSNATRGTLKGVVDLTNQQRGALEKLSLYIQINSEKAPEGNLWGWLFPQEVKR
ncbi:MAG: CHRD domain-containing protein [Acidobacteria bacterium]|nr:CHRD domain-containing protein [Acidobacteriota bacterium]